jgi:hypothetical protein
MKYKAILAFIVLMIIKGSSWCLDESLTNRPSLKGITAIRVAVEEPTPDHLRMGWSALRIQREVESQLQKAGIAILRNEDDWLKTSGKPTL